MSSSSTMWKKSSGPTVICTTSAPNASQMRLFSTISGWQMWRLSKGSCQMMHLSPYRAAWLLAAARYGLKCIICQETFDSRHIGQPEIVEKSRLCEAFGAEVVQMTVGPELFFHMVELLDVTGYFAASLYSSFGVSGIETLGLEIANEMTALTGAPPTHCVITHAGGGAPV